MLEFHCPNCMKYCGNLEEVENNWGDDTETIVLKCDYCKKKYQITVKEVK